MLKVRPGNTSWPVWCTKLLIVFVLFVAGPATGQEGADTVASLPGIEIETSVDLAEIYIGDLITYKVRITYDSTYELIPTPLGANLGAFDVKDYQPDLSSSLAGGRIQSETIFSLTTFTTGDYIIPPLPVVFILPDSSRKLLLAEAVPIKVKSLLAGAGDSLDIRPPKVQYEFRRSLSAYYLYGGVALLLLVVGIIIWLLLRKKKSLAEQVDLRPPWEIAFEKLAFLRERNLLDAGADKQYYFELTEIMRGYMGRMYEVEALEMTTQEFLGCLEEMALPSGLFDRMDDFLTHADLVKFAKFIPLRERAESDFEFVHETIEAVRVNLERWRQAELAAGEPPSTGAPAMTSEGSGA